MAECTNDCKTPLQFPKTIFNRPSLPHIDYRIGTYADFRDALLRKLDLDPVLAAWTYRSVDDPGIALIESAAIIGDILTLYQDTYANELYLETATLRDSVAGLVQLLGYRLSPGVGGRAVFAFQVKGDRPVVIPAKFPITADVQGLPDTATFETADSLNAIPALGKFTLFQPFHVPPVLQGTSTFAIETTLLTATLEKGNRVMLMDPAGTSNPYHQIAVIDKVEARFEQTEVTIQGAWLGPNSPKLTAYKLGRDFRHFGYNAPPTVTVVSGGTTTTQNVSFRRYNLAVIFLGSQAYSYNPLSSSTLPLDKAVDDISAAAVFLVGMDVIGLFAGSSTTFRAHSVLSVQKGSLTVGSLTGGSTILTLDSFVPFDRSTDIRSVEIHETTAGPFSFTAPRVPLTSPRNKLYFFGNGIDYQALDGRVLQFQRRKPLPGQPDAVEQIPVSIAQSEVGNPARITLRALTLQAEPAKLKAEDFPFTFPKDAPPVWVYGNLAAATQGKTEKPAVLGNGDARAEFLTLAIPKLPLTYLLSNSATPPEVPELVVTVDGIEWTQVSSLLTYGPKDQVYIVREDLSGQSYVQFGDGVTGARVPSGTGNIQATYRTGNGAYGPMKPGTTPNPGARLTLLDTVSLLDESSGGTQPEDASNARITAPGKVQSLGRIVSLRDYETEAAAIPGVSMVSAAWEIVDNIPLVVLTVLMDTGRAAELAAVTELLHNYNVCRGPQRHALHVRPGARRYVFCDASIALAPGYLQDSVFPNIQAALASLFSNKRAFGEREYRSRIEGVIQNVEGVLWNSVTALGDLGLADDPSKLALSTPPRSLQETLPCGAAEVLALYPAHLTLAAVASPLKVC
jgi:hypothetical protein